MEKSCYHSWAPEFTPDSCCSIISFPCNVLLIVVCPLALFLLAIVLSVLLRYTNSDYPFGIFWPLCCRSSSIYGFWLPLWYLLAIVLSFFFDLRILIIHVVSSYSSYSVEKSNVARSFVFFVIFCRSLFAVLFFFVWQLQCHFFFQFSVSFDKWNFWKRKRIKIMKNFF